MNFPLNKSLSERLKNVGFNFPVGAFYFRDHDMLYERKEVQNFNSALNKISAPTISEVIEWMDSNKRLYVVPNISIHIDENGEMKETWSCAIIDMSEQNEYSFNGSTIHNLQTRSEASLAGLEPAITFLEIKKRKDDLLLV